MERVDKALVLARYVFEYEQQLSVAAANGSEVGVARIASNLLEAQRKLSSALDGMGSDERFTYNEKLARVRVLSRRR